MSTTEVLDQGLLTWEKQNTDKVLAKRDAIVEKYGKAKFDDVLARAVELDDERVRLYREFRDRVDSSVQTLSNPSDPKEWYAALLQARDDVASRASSDIVSSSLRERLSAELVDVGRAAKVFKQLKDHFGAVYGDPDQALQEYLTRPEYLGQALRDTLNGFSSFPRFWQEQAEPALRAARAEDSGVDVENVVSERTDLVGALRVLGSGSAAEVSASVGLEGMNGQYLLGKMAKWLPKVDQKKLEAHPEEFGKLAVARMAYLQLAGNRDEYASEIAESKGIPYEKAVGEVTSQMIEIEKNVERAKSSLPKLKKDPFVLPPAVQPPATTPGKAVARNLLRGGEKFTRGLREDLLPPEKETEIRGMVGSLAPAASDPGPLLGFQNVVDMATQIGFLAPGGALGEGLAAAGVKRLAPGLGRAAAGAIRGAGAGAIAEAGNPAIAPSDLGGRAASVGIGAAAGGALGGAAGAIGPRVGSALRGPADRAAQASAAQSRKALDSFAPTEATRVSPKVDTPETVVLGKQPSRVPGDVAAAEAATAKPAGTPEERLIKSLKEYRKLTPEKESMFSAQRKARIGGFNRSLGEKGASGEARAKKAMGTLKGELERPDFKPVREAVSQDDIDYFFNTVADDKFVVGYEKATAFTALRKLFDPVSPQLPAPGEINLLARIFGEKFTRELQRTPPSALKRWAAEIAGAPRAFLATADMSAPLRQGLVAGAAYPKQWGSAFAASFKPAVSHKAFKELAVEIAERPTYEAMRRANLALSAIDSHGGRLQVREEEFMSRLPHHIPIFRAIANFSERAHSGFLTRLRADAFDELLRRASKAGVDIENPKFLKDAGRFINSATGRGPMGQLEDSAPVLAQAFFSPRLIASRVDLLANPWTYFNADDFVRKEALRSMMNTIGGGTLLVGLAKAGGVDVEMDPTNSDFGKMQFGDTRVDPWGGIQQYAVFASRIASSKTTSPVTNKTREFGPGDRSKLTAQFLANKVNPAIAFATIMLDGWNEDGKLEGRFGDETEPIRAVEDALFPIMVQDFMDIMEEDPNLLPLLAPAFFGVGVSTFPTKGEGKERVGEFYNRVIK